MIFNIAGDTATKMSIYAIDGVIFIILGIYSVIWVRKGINLKLFKPIPMQEVMAMENDMYMVTHRRQKNKDKG